VKSWGSAVKRVTIDDLGKAIVCLSLPRSWSVSLLPLFNPPSLHPSALRIGLQRCSLGQVWQKTGTRDLSCQVLLAGATALRPSSLAYSASRACTSAHAHITPVLPLIKVLAITESSHFTILEALGSVKTSRFGASSQLWSSLAPVPRQRATLTLVLRLTSRSHARPPLIHACHSFVTQNWSLVLATST
jgi:hypothetical protein